MVLTRRGGKAAAAGDQKDSKESEKLPADGPSIVPAPEWEAKLQSDWRTDVGRSLGRRIFHWGPIVALALIFYIGFVAGTLALSWWPLNTIGGFLHFSLFLFWNYATLNNFLKAAFSGGGYLPNNWIPDTESPEKHLQYCNECKGFKAARSHHCSKCRRCVLKMDHHCPWINNCVGHRNHAHFVFFLAAACAGCVHACIVIGLSLYHGLNLAWYHRYAVKGTYPVVQLSITWFLVAVLACALSLGVAVGVGMLCVIQLRGIARGTTALEDYIISKAVQWREEKEDDGEKVEPFLYPYHYGWKINFREIFADWGITRGNGVWWPVVEGTHQFTLSEEQLRQKAAKRERARLVKILQPFKGGWFGSLSVGPKAFFCQPISEEARVAVEEGERWLVTRGQKHWLYGRRVGEEGTDQPKGWFPRRYAMLIGEQNDED